MKKAIWLLSLLIFLLLPASFNRVTAQIDYFAYENGYFEPGIVVYVFSETSALKERPAIEARDLKVLHQGDHLVVVNVERGALDRNGVKQFWYRAEQTNDSGKVSSGYISGHDLALGALPFLINYKRDLLLLQITDHQRTDAYQMTAKIVRNGKTIATTEFSFIAFPNNPEWPDYTIAVLKNIQTGIDSISEVAEITFHHQKSHYPSGISYLIWNGAHLGYLCETMYLMEPGLFEFDSMITYPGRNGVKPGSVKLTKVAKEFDEAAEQYIETDREITIFHWDGTKVTASEE